MMPQGNREQKEFSIFWGDIGTLPSEAKKIGKKKKERIFFWGRMGLKLWLFWSKIIEEEEDLERNDSVVWISFGKKGVEVVTA